MAESDRQSQALNSSITTIGVYNEIEIMLVKIESSQL